MPILSLEEPVICHPANPVSDLQSRRMLTGHNTGTRRGANRTGGIKLCKTGAFCRQTIYVGGLVKSASVYAGIPPPQIINQDDHHVGRGHIACGYKKQQKTESLQNVTSSSIVFARTPVRDVWCVAWSPRITV